MGKSGIPFTYKLQKIIQPFPCFKVDGTLVKCIMCNQRYPFKDSYAVKRHIRSQKHQDNIGTITRAEFLYDLCLFLCTCGLSWKLVDSTGFKKFCRKYLPTWPLPSSETLRRIYLPNVYTDAMNSIKEDVRNKYIWLTAAETVDSQGHKVVNILLRVLSVDHSGPPILIASKRVSQTTAETIDLLVTEALRNVCVSDENILMFVTDAAAYMRKVAERLKRTYINMTHVTCLAHSLHLVAAEIAEQYPMVDQLVWNTKKIFVKAWLRKAHFKAYLPDTPLPPQPVRTRRCTWLQSVGYFATYFDGVKEFVLQLDPLESEAVRLSQNAFKAPNMYADLNTIQQRFSCLVDATQRLQNAALSSEEALTVIADVQNTLLTFEDRKSAAVKHKLEDVLNKNMGYQAIRNIHRNGQNDIASHNNYVEYLKFAPLTSVDAERSFLLYKHMYRPDRSNLTAENAERILVTMVYSQAREDYALRDECDDGTCE